MMDKPTKEEIGQLPHPEYMVGYARGHTNGKEEGRLSAFKEMRDYAKKKGDFYDAERLQHLMGSPDEVIAHAKMKQYDEMEKFAEAKMKGEMNGL